MMDEYSREGFLIHTYIYIYTVCLCVCVFFGGVLKQIAGEACSFRELVEGRQTWQTREAALALCRLPTHSLMVDLYMFVLP